MPVCACTRSASETYVALVEPTSRMRSGLSWSTTSRLAVLPRPVRRPAPAGLQSLVGGKRALRDDWHAATPGAGPARVCRAGWPRADPPETRARRGTAERRAARRHQRAFPGPGERGAALGAARPARKTRRSISIMPRPPVVVPGWRGASGVNRQRSGLRSMRRTVRAVEPTHRRSRPRAEPRSELRADQVRADRCAQAERPAYDAIAGCPPSRVATRCSQ